MLASLNFVERFVSLPKKNVTINNFEKDFHFFAYDTSVIAQILTKQGFEVDNIAIKGEGLFSVVVGKIEKCEPHPTANKLQICCVRVSESHVLQIVCGAPNAREGLYVAVALCGTKMPNGLEIKPTKIRDIESFGMLCSREELGLPLVKEIDGNGIWEIENQAQGGLSSQILQKRLGEPVFVALGIFDTLLEISVTPNRPDMLCHEGIARELMAGFSYAKVPFEKKENCYFSSRSKTTEEKIKNDAIKNSVAVCDGISFSCENSLNAPTFFILIDKLSVVPSCAWLRNLLENLGQNSINNIVDASNFVLLAYGQPNHAFDLQKISSTEPNVKKLSLRLAENGEKFVGLDGKERVLTNADAVVADSQSAQALLGVIGGDNSKVTYGSSKIAVEFANPNSVAIRRTSRRHGRQTDASFAFEKGINEEQRFKAAAEFYALVCSEQSNEPIYCGAVHSQNKNKEPMLKTEFESTSFVYSDKEQEKVLGANILSFKAQLDILKSLGFGLQEQDSSHFKITVPSWRRKDIFGTADLVEEFIRVVGIDLVPPATFYAPAVANQDDPLFAFLEKVSAQCAALGYNEVMSLHFMRADDFKKLKLASINALGEPVALLNPIIGDEPLMHNTLMPDLLRKVAKNLSYGIRRGQIFHSCRTFQNYDFEGNRVFNENGNTLDIANDLKQKVNEDLYEYSYLCGYEYSKEATQKMRPVETPRLAGVCFGNKVDKNWQNTAPAKWCLHDVISHVHHIARCFGVSVQVSRMNESSHPYQRSLHPGRNVLFSVSTVNGLKPVGFAGELHPNTMRNFEIDEACYVFEMNMAVLFQTSIEPKNVQKRIVALQKFPTVKRDFAFLLDNNTTAEQLTVVVQNSLQQLLKTEIPAILSSVNIFDIYKGKGVPENKKSVAFEIAVEPTERTFNEKEVTKITNQVVKEVKNNLQGELRG